MKKDLNQLYFRTRTRIRVWRYRLRNILNPVRVVHAFVYPRLTDLERRVRELEARIDQIQRRP